MSDPETVRARPTRLAAWCLSRVLARDRADAVLGDIAEDLARRVVADRAPRWPRLWCEGQTWRYVIVGLAADGPSWLRRAVHVLRDAWRALRTAPAATVMAIVVLGLASAAATVTFSVVDHVVLRSLPFADAGTLYVLTGAGNPSSSRAVAPQEYMAWEGHLDGFSSMAAIGAGVGIDESGERVLSVPATASLFDVLRVPPMMGRVFTAANEVPGNEQVAVVSYGYWLRHFGGDPHVVGRTLTLTWAQYTSVWTVIGVMPEGFSYPVNTDRTFDVWVPYADRAQWRVLPHGGLSSYLRIVGRLAPGATPEIVQQQMVRATAPLVQAFPFNYQRGWPPAVTPLADATLGNVRWWMLAALAAVVLVMGIACVNVANLMLMRSTYRVREFAVRASLGASRRQLVCALLVESVVLSIAGLALGLTVAVWGVAAVKAALPPGIARASSIALDARVFAIASLAAIVTGVLFGLVPAWQASRCDLVGLLKDSGPTVASGRRRWRVAFMVAELAMVSVLLLATTLFVGSFVEAVRTDLGFDRRGLITTAQVSNGATIADTVAEIARIPGVVSVGAMSGGGLPLTGAGSSAYALARPDGGSPIDVDGRRATSSYFRTAGVRVERGELFPDDPAAQTGECVIDELAARALFGDADPIGQPLKMGAAGAIVHVIGVVSHVQVDGPEAPPGPQAYFPLAATGKGAQFLVRVTRPAAEVIPSIRAIVSRKIPAGWSAPDVTDLGDTFRRVTAQRRFTAGLMAIFGGLALVIGAAGVYSVIASMVAQEQREIGVRLALGATPRAIARGVIASTGKYVLAGLAIGLAAAFAAARGFASLFYRVQPTDVAVYVIVAIALGLVAFVAALLPARRAARVDPVMALRGE